VTGKPQIESACRELENRLEGQSQIADLKAVDLDLSIVPGQLQRALNDAIRKGGTTPPTVGGRDL
jgi:hypothetical protein